jgi:hypothetical protein
MALAPAYHGYDCPVLSNPMLPFSLLYIYGIITVLMIYYDTSIYILRSLLLSSSVVRSLQ